MGFLWDTNFLAERTLERYIDIFKNFTNQKKSRYENDFISFAKYFCDNFSIENAFLSWEDFFWPVRFVEGQDKPDWFIEQKTKEFIEYLLGKIDRNNLFVEQRTNRFFKKINHKGKLNYGYFNYLCNYKSWAALVQDGGVIENSLVVEKGFIEWLSIMVKQFNLGNDNKLIIDQFNIIDNTIDDDPDNHHHRVPEFNPCKLSLEKAASFFDFVLPIMNRYIHGLGFWNLWTTRLGHIYNGTFIFGAKGWTTDGYIQPDKYQLTLTDGQSVNANLGYIRCDPKNKIFIYLEFLIHEPCELQITFNQTVQTIKLKDTDKTLTYAFSSSNDRALRIDCIMGKISVHRIDCFNFYSHSIFFNENRVPSQLWEAIKGKW